MHKKIILTLGIFLLFGALSGCTKNMERLTSQELKERAFDGKLQSYDFWYYAGDKENDYVIVIDRGTKHYFLVSKGSVALPYSAFSFSNNKNDWKVLKVYEIDFH